MADRAGASITIGGTLRQALIPNFLAAIADDHLCVDHGDKLIEEADLVFGAPFYGAASEASGAQFEATEGFCRAHGLRYIRRSDGCGGAWDPGIEIYAGDGEICSFDVTSAGTAVITLDDLCRLGTLSAIEAHFSAADIDTGPLVLGEAEPPVTDA